MTDTPSATQPGSAQLLRLGFSPCPNDTFMFHGLVNGGVDTPGFRVAPSLHDIETLNRMAMEGELEVTKLSFFAWLALKERYRLLNAGAAMGFGCGPLVVSRRSIPREEMAGCRVVLPGEWTTAHLLFRLWAPEAERRIFAPYDRIVGAVQSGEADCGVIIHETRFTYREAGLTAMADLGEWWEEKTGLPIPLGCIAARSDLPGGLVTALEGAIRRSIEAAVRAPRACLPYIRRYAREMDAGVLDRHIRTFVNDFSLSLGDAGRRAVDALEAAALEAGVVP